jgi:phage tail-like protein
MQDAPKLNPIAFIKLEMGGIEADALFMSCTLPSGSIHPSDAAVYEMQGGNDAVHTPAKINWSPITLTRGIDSKKSCYDWFIQMAEKGPGPDTQKTCKIELLDAEKNTVMAWSLEQAWISDYSASASEAGGSGVATETMTVSYTKATRES